MKLYLAPGACSLATHIALHEAGVEFERHTVDLKTHTLEDGSDFHTINPKGYVPALVLDDGGLLTENVALLDWVAQRHPALGVLEGSGEKSGSTRLIEMLAFISTEIHKQFGRSFFPSSPAEKEQALKKVAERLQWLAGRLEGEYLFGSGFSVADAYFYVMLRWTKGKQLDLPEALRPYMLRVEARPAVQMALLHEEQQPLG